MYMFSCLKIYVISCTSRHLSDQYRNNENEVLCPSVRHLAPLIHYHDYGPLKVSVKIRTNLLVLFRAHQTRLQNRVHQATLNYNNKRRVKRAAIRPDRK